MKDSHLSIYKYFTKHQLGMTSVVSKGDKLYCILYTRFIFEVININFCQIWLLDVKGTGWLGLQLSTILAQL